MPSGLLVQHIPYREMISLGLKVGIRRVSYLPCVVLCGLWGLIVTRSWSVPSLEVTCSAGLGLSFLMDYWTALIRLCSRPVRRCHR